MKNLIVVIAVFIGASAFGQDYKLFVDINKYREANGENVLIFDEGLHSVITLATRVASDKTIQIEKRKFWKKHYSVPKDSVEFIRFLKHKRIKVSEFKNFLASVYNVKLKISKETDVEPYMLYYVMFKIDRDKRIKDDVLNVKNTRGSANVIINEKCICYGVKFK